MLGGAGRDHASGKPGGYLLLSHRVSINQGRDRRWLVRLASLCRLVLIGSNLNDNLPAISNNAKMEK